MQAPLPSAALVTGPPRRIRGVIFDSLLSSAPLRGAVLTLDATTRMTVANDSGAFEFDSVSPGMHRLVVRHPMLDSMGIDTIGVPMSVGAQGDAATAALPDAERFMRLACNASRTRTGDGMLLGVVRNARTDQPMPGVEVAAAWRSNDSSYAGGGLRERLRVRTSATGQFVLCRTPRFTALELWAIASRRETPRVRLQLGAAILGNFDLSVEPDTAATASDAAAATGIISGRVLTLSGDGLPNATVILDRPDTRTVTDSAGQFAFSQVPAGVRSVEIRSIGYRPSKVGINLRPSQIIARDITLDRTVAVLGTVTVTARRRTTWDSIGFEGRKRKGGGYFFDRRDLQGIADLSTALRMVPGIQGRSSDRAQRLVAGRGAGCFPAFIVNGVRFAAGGSLGPEAMIRATDVRAIEVYMSRLSTPAEHQRYADCAVIVIWLRDPQAEREARSRP